ncbi:hypothetical protein I6H96_02515 [Brucella anthropi]|uniref:Uncharacterized protein n=1 Tax=Brucella anthropi (strain ATCC 49188 / DSM 6882 / CCUG 24695 / JCM 21032 / LMG 3331 / NBRC 15819 / NCTC 12168 / Alc 37) TaxID=439375 RepID=A6WZ25_BRUA4|nr:hypothetical protein [Brucella anthropi]ABS14229.1 hypothetical protein Oant_1513 [Brucella anthropi ATCC 49188]NKC48117.1 hypothetical protein [Brucella anthropi ATCC 49188]QQC25755.1 hypothetical protein I6H96_02515 [Brucella anthropi]SUA65539.1 Uncharacterised protein [Brucella anthropi]
MKTKFYEWLPGRGPMFGGCLLFGHILPFIGYERIPCHFDGEPADHDPATGDTNGTHTVMSLTIEWLGFGMAHINTSTIKRA